MRWRSQAKEPILFPVGSLFLAGAQQPQQSTAKVITDMNGEVPGAEMH